MLEALNKPPAGLFWSEPTVLDSDFSAEDPLAFDYLEQQIGLWLFRGFTTRTNRAQYYPVVLFGLHLADLAIEKYGYLGDDEVRTRLFERWERFWALATLEYRDGKLERRDDDSMRGVRGATRAWFAGKRPLPLDFQLISRQSELGGLGAYLSSLRENGLVFPGTLRVTPAGQPLADAFWAEKGKADWGHRYEDYALLALDLDRNAVKRHCGHLTLAGLGKRSRLSALVERSREQQQERLWQALFLNSRDGSTLPLAKCLIRSKGRFAEDPEARLTRLQAGKWGKLEKQVLIKVEAALAFGRVAQKLLDRFNRAYGHVVERGWVADIDEAARAAFPRNEMKALRVACKTARHAPGAARLRSLQYHGSSFLNLLDRLARSGPSDSLRHLLDYHRGVQKSRRGGGAWLHEERGKLIMQLAGYSGYRRPAGFPSFKLGAVGSLLEDLGKL